MKAFRSLFVALLLVVSALPAWAQSIAINAIGSLRPAVTSTIAGTLSGYGSAPGLQYSVNGSAFVTASGGTITTTAFSFTLPAQVTIATSSLVVRDTVLTGITATAPFAVAGATETPGGFYTVVPGVVITDSCGDAFALTPTGQQFYQNGIPIGAAVTEIAYFNHQIYQFGSNAWYFSTCATNSPYTAATTPPAVSVETIAINSISSQVANVPFTVGGTVSGAVVLPVMRYQVNAGPLTTFAYSTINGPFSFTAPGLPVATVDTITILDALVGTSANSNAFCVATGGLPGRPILILFGFNRTYPYVTDAAL